MANLNVDEQHVETVSSVCDIDKAAARELLLKHNGDLEKAVNAGLARHDTDNDSIPPLETPVIDLTGDNQEDFARAVQLSMETSQENRLVPTDRAPHPAWQLVRANTPANPLSPDDELRRAIRASLEEFTSDEDLTLEHSVREFGRPVAFRSDSSALAYAALVIHALFHIPQVRQHVANIQPPSIEQVNPDAADMAIWKLLEMFTNLDLAQISMVHDSGLLSSLKVESLQNLSDHPGDLAAQLYKRIGRLLDDRVNEKQHDTPKPRLFHYSTGTVEEKNGSFRTIRRDEGCDVVIELYNEPGINELIAKLSSSLFHGGTRDVYDTIFEPSKVVAFNLKPSGKPSTNPEPFRYPKLMFLDQFLAKNIVVSMQKRAQQQKANGEIHALKQRKVAITNYQNRDTLKDLETSIDYYEQLASGKENPDRLAAITKTVEKLKQVVVALKQEIEAIDSELARLEDETKRTYESADLQQHPYELRSVLVYTGVPGRKNIYSYVKDANGTWWKTVDHGATQVREDVVFTDSTGLRLGGGPFMLIYSRVMSNEKQILENLSWPPVFATDVFTNNRQFIESLPPEIAAKAQPAS